jgi:hypothetical protein
MLVVIAGMVRSGSTFSFNIARELLAQTGDVATFSGNSIEQAIAAAGTAKHLLLKTHGPDSLTSELIRLGEIPCICTIRKPEDAIRSWMTTFGFDLDGSIAALQGWLIWHRQMAGNVKTVQYDAIEQSPKEVIADIHRYICGQVNVPLLEEQLHRYDKQRLQQWLTDMPLGADTVDIGFSYYDKETFFHRRHISANTAELTEADQLKIRQALADYVNEAGALASP